MHWRWYIEAETKWPSFGSRHFQVHFLAWKILNKISLKYVPYGLIGKICSIGSDYGLTPQVTSHYLRQWWFVLLAHICITWPQGVKVQQQNKAICLFWARLAHSLSGGCTLLICTYWFQSPAVQVPASQRRTRSLKRSGLVRPAMDSALQERWQLTSWETVCRTWIKQRFNLLAPGKFKWNFEYVIFKQILVIDGWGIACEIALIWMSLDFTDDQSTLVQVLAWCHQATSHYLSQCWPRSLPPYGVTRPQWVNS